MYIYIVSYIKYIKLSLSICVCVQRHKWIVMKKYLLRAQNNFYYERERQQMSNFESSPHQNRLFVKRPKKTTMIVCRGREGNTAGESKRRSNRIYFSAGAILMCGNKHRWQGKGRRGHRCERVGGSSILLCVCVCGGKKTKRPDSHDVVFICWSPWWGGFTF